MNTLLQQNSVICLKSAIAYPDSGVQRQTLLEDANCRYILLSMAAGAKVAEHAASRNVTVQGIEGQGLLTLKGKALLLEPGVLIFMPASALHSISADTNLTVLLTLSEKVDHNP
ncbi:cupin domain-containing protein [Altericista sp. CCNU0014]|uniref:cupin domain-containing protein n=1 Tax=Altericista sp. CCNU0014 TaxID=3082949 RepID=UPI00384D473C